MNLRAGNGWDMENALKIKIKIKKNKIKRMRERGMKGAGNGDGVVGGSSSTMTGWLWV